jgi:hypothetical protein
MLSVPDMEKWTILDKVNPMGTLRMQALVYGNNFGLELAICSPTIYLPRDRPRYTGFVELC